MSKNYITKNIFLEKKYFLKRWVNIFSDNEMDFCIPKFSSYEDLKTGKFK